ncbi:MAG TPA: adenylosuccinate synthase [Candidatus Saccharimonadales bacterium]|nr:adenylosuccinate synthase [Candidatus Saccharimonadales bacterium]
MSVDVLVGLQRGDEGKGRFVDMLAADYDIVARFNGGNNAGHTVVLPDERVLKLHLAPSGITHPDTVNIIGNGTLVNPVKLVEEIEDIESKDIEVTKDNLKLSSGSHLILPHHIYEDELREANPDRSQGSTKTGIAPVAAFKAMRYGARTEEIRNNPEELFTIVYDALVAQRLLREEAGLGTINDREVAKAYIEAAIKVGKYVTDTVFYLNQRLRGENPARVLAEGAQAFLLDIDHGMYPFTTSTSTVSGGAVTGLGIPPQKINKVMGVAKAVQSHVGGGPFVTEVLDPDLRAQLHGDKTTVDAEYGTTTGRKRRLGYLDLPQIRRSNMINGTDEMIISKLDWVPRFGKQVLICVAYDRKGKTLDISPDSARKLDQSTPTYESLPTWNGSIQHVRQFGDLPGEAKAYIEFIESQTEVPISMIGVGPNADQVIIR